MAVISRIIPVDYWLVLIPAAAAIAWLTVIMSKRVKSKRASPREAPLLRLYETRLQTASAGDAAGVKRLIDAELKRRPYITQLEAARCVYKRFKRARRSAWSNHNVR
jgi:hypothetical protein